jgi:hypothetical protein
MQRNRVGNVALVLSAIGLISLFLFAMEPLTWLLRPVSLLCPIGLLLGLIALWRPPRRSAIWAIVLGLFGSLYLPTLWLF